MDASAIGTAGAGGRARPNRPAGSQPGTFGRFPRDAIASLGSFEARFPQVGPPGSDEVAVEFLRLRAEAARLSTAALRESLDNAARLLAERPQDVTDKLDQAEGRFVDRQAELAALDREIGRVRAATPAWRLVRRRRPPKALRELEGARALVDMLAEATWNELIALWDSRNHRERWDAAHRDVLVRAQVHLLEFQQRQDQALDWLQEDPPAYLSALLGAPPKAGSDRPAGVYRLAQWRRGAYEIECYRAEAGVDDPARALGQPPTDSLPRYRYERALQVVEQVQAGLGIGEHAQHPDLTIEQPGHSVQAVDEPPLP